jgi:hypothetical protein
MAIAVQESKRARPGERPACSVEDCDTLRDSQGYCKRHYARYRRYGDPLKGGKRQFRNPATCTAGGSDWSCDNPCRALNLCAAHWSQQKKGQQLAKVIKPFEYDFCQASGILDGEDWYCYKSRRLAYLCVGHHAQWKTKGVLVPIGTGRYGEYRFNDDGDRKCSKCTLFLTLDNFSVNSASPDGLYSYCKTCRSHAGRLNRYGITPEQYEDLLREQDGKCPVCRNVLGVSKQIAVDHDHACCPTDKTCGKCTRGILCSQCNHGLGSFGDSIESLSAAIIYLTHAKSRAF